MDNDTLGNSAKKVFVLKLLFFEHPPHRLVESQQTLKDVRPEPNPSHLCIIASIGLLNQLFFELGKVLSSVDSKNFSGLYES